MNRKIKRLVIILAAVLLLLFIAIGWLSNLMFNFALNPNASFTMGTLLQGEQVEGVEVDPANNENENEALNEFYSRAANWFESNQKTTLIAEDGVTLSGYYFPYANSHRYVIVCHGYGGNAAQMSGCAMQLYNMGFSILIPDARAHGNSEGNYYGMGWLERKDLLGWANQLIASDPNAEIALYGISMGGATVMMTAGEELPDQIRCIVEDCGYTSVWDEFSLQLKTLFRAPNFPLMYTSDLVCRVRAGYGFKEASSVEQLKKAKVPMLFIHGEDDTFVPYAMLNQVYNACASSEKEKLTIPNAGHGAASTTDPERYWNTVEAFLNKYFK